MTNIIHHIFSLERQTPFVMKVLEALLMPKQINTLLEPEQIDTIVSWARTCKTIFKICTKECEDRLLVLLPTLNPNNTNLVLYKNHLRKWYLHMNSSTPLRWTIFSLLHCPVEKKIQWVILPPNITLWLYRTRIHELLSQTSDNKIHILTLCELLDLVYFTHILVKFPSLIKLQLIRVVLNGRLFNQDISLSNLVTLWIIECDLTDCNLNNWTSSLKKLQKLKWENNKWNTNVNPIIDLTTSINYISIIHTN
jgi:hypothetical protein